jgi:hypothetical protein
MLAHPHMLRFEAAQNEETGHRRERRAREVAQAAVPDEEDRSGVADHDAAEEIAMAIDVFR